MSAVNDLKKIIKRIEKTLGVAVTKKQMQDLGEFARDLIVKRTRLGYGVPDELKEKARLAALAPSYIKQRKQMNLASTTRPGRSNLTQTGQMLESLKVIVKNGAALITPHGTRDDGKTNLEVATYNAIGDLSRNRPPRVFNQISRSEYNQIMRFYRRSFTDLLKKIKS